MNALPYSQARSNLAKTMDKVCDDHAPVIITRKNQRSVVVISLRTTSLSKKRLIFCEAPGTHGGSLSP